MIQLNLSNFFFQFSIAYLFPRQCVFSVLEIFFLNGQKPSSLNYDSFAYRPAPRPGRLEAHKRFTTECVLLFRFFPGVRFPRSLPVRIASVRLFSSECFPVSISADPQHPHSIDGLVLTFVVHLVGVPPFPFCPPPILASYVSPVFGSS